MSADYGVEWAYGEFRIARYMAGQAVESWTSPEPVYDLKSLSEAMNQATGFVDIDRGGTVAIVYEDDQHIHEFLQIPNLDRRDREKYLARRVTSTKPFEGPAAWCYCLKPTLDGMQGVLLHMMPKNIVDAVMRICGDHFLVPQVLVPLPEVVRQRLMGVDLGNSENILGIVAFEERTQMIVCRADGELLFVRELNYACTTSNRKRLLTDVERTIGYAKQSEGAVIDVAWLVGERAGAILPEIEDDLPVRALFDEQSQEANFWTTLVAEFDKKSHKNLIPRRQRRTLNPRTLLRAGILTTALTATASIAIATVVEVLMVEHDFDQSAIETTMFELEEERARLQSQLAEVDEARAQLSVIDIDAFNLPALFASHLGDLVPEGLVLTEVSVERQTEGWEFALAGVSSLSLGDTAPVLRTLEDALTREPWNATVSRSWEIGWMEQLRSGLAATDGVVGFEMRSLVK